MNPTQEKALFQLTGKSRLSRQTMADALQIAERAPYFAPARFFSIAGGRNTFSREAWANEASRTNLYFTNPLWLHYQLGSIGETVEEQTSRLESYAVPTVEAVREMMRKVDPSQETTGHIEEEPDADDTDMPEMETETEAGSKIAGILSNQLADFKKPLAEDAVLDIAPEPKKMHTIDYFASQGIKVDLASLPPDKLTTHLAKFTDWLKQMKKIQSAEPSDLGTNPEMEKAVAENALQSNETREVVTETMAEVLAQQGQTEKAIQLYIKLSFINPEKSSYFAAKIDQLKGI